VKSHNVNRTHRPVQGQVAFVAFVASFAAAMCAVVPTGYCLDRREGPMNPGVGSA